MVENMEAAVQRWVSGQMLTPGQLALEKELRPKLLSALSEWRTSRYELGKVLAKYREHFDGLYKSLYDELDLDERQARRLVEDFERASKVDEPVRRAALNRGYDIAEKKHQVLGDALATIKATDEVEITTAVKEAVTAYLNAKKAAKKGSVVPDAELESDYVPEQPKLVAKARRGASLDADVDAALEWLSEQEIRNAIADAVKAKRGKKPVQRAA